MKILIDADGCPVVDLTIEIAKWYQIECVIVCDTAHIFQKEGARTVTVGKGADSVDFMLLNLAEPGDIVVTQDYGLAAMCIAKRAAPIDQNGTIYHQGNIDAVLNSRYAARKIRNAGGRTKGPRKRTADHDDRFQFGLVELIEGMGERCDF